MVKQQTTSFDGLKADKPREMLEEHEKNYSSVFPTSQVAYRASKP